MTAPNKRTRIMRMLLLLGVLATAGAYTLSGWFGGGCACSGSSDRGTERADVGATADVPGTVEILINLDDDRDDLEATLEDTLGVELRLNSRYADDANLFIARIPVDQADAVLDTLNATEGVEYAERNGIMAVPDVPDVADLTPFTGSAEHEDPDDPLYMFQWHFDQIDIEGAWPITQGDGVVVAVIDTGVAYEEGRRGSKRGIQMPDLSLTDMVDGYDFVDDDDKPWDQQGHGTHVAGTIAQSTGNAYGVAGIAYRSSIMPLRVLDAQGRGSYSDVADSIRYAADEGADVINLSLGGPLPSREVESAIRYAHEQGVVVVAAAGNAGNRVRSYPAAFKHVIAVSATQFDRKTTFYSNYGSYIDIAAPGGNTLLDQNDDGKPDGVLQETLERDRSGIKFKPTFALYMGTSMAAPHVAAVAALIVEQGVSNPDEVERILRDTASDAGKDGWDERYGDGILNAGNAVTSERIDSGLWYTGGSLFLLLLTLFGLRRRDALDPSPKQPTLWFGWALGAGALFVLPLLFGATGALGTALDLAGRPFVAWDTILLGPGSLSPLLASALPATAAVLLLYGWRPGRHFAAGFAIACGAALMIAAGRHTFDVAWIPGIGLLDQLWLVANGLFAAALGCVSLKR